MHIDTFFIYLGHAPGDVLINYALLQCAATEFMISHILIKFLFCKLSHTHLVSESAVVKFISIVLIS
jgi:hypothetical protein